MRVAFLGPEGSFSHEAARRAFLEAELVPVETISKVFPAVGSSKADFGLIPLENSIEGSVNASLDALAATDLVIVAELLLDVRQCFLSNEKERPKIKRIFSHPQGFAQCRGWIHANFPEAELVECSSTARAAEKASVEKGSAAIASEASAKKFSIAVMERDIHDLEGNKTRFAVVSLPENASKFSVRRGSKFKTSVLFGVKDKPGSLFDAIKSFKEHKVNMSKIESRPSKKNAWEYVFFVDLDGKSSDDGMALALKELATHCEFVRVLGSYPRVE